MVLPGRESIAGATFSVISTQEFQQHVSGAPDDGAVLLLVCSSLAFLVPARSSFVLGRLWHAWLFLILSFICVAYYACDGDLQVRMGFHGTCPQEMRQGLLLLHHAWAYFCLLQMAYLVLGPEDPHMQWIDHPVVLDTPRSALAMSSPMDVVVVSRVLPAASIGIFVCTFSSWEDFHWQISILNEALLLFGCSTFWLHRDRRASMPKVLLRIRFWRRLWNHCVLPLLACSFILVLMESVDARVSYACWHVLLAMLAVNLVRVVHNDTNDMEHEAEVANISPQNPVVARILLGSVAMFGLPTLILSLALDWWAVGHWRWPRVFKSTHQWPGGYFVVIGALPTLVAQAASFWLIASTVGAANDLEEIVLSKQFGCLTGHVSVAFGFLTIAVPDVGFPTAHTLCMILFLSLMMVAMLMTTLSVRQPLALATRNRFFLMLLIFASVFSFLVLSILAQQDQSHTYGIPHPWLSLSEYTTLALPMLWPLTWGAEVQDRWQTHKVWRSFTKQMV